MQLEDRFAHPITVASHVALDAYHAGIDAMFALQPGAIEHLDHAIAEDGDFAMAYAARARAHLANADTAAARLDADRANELARYRTERERQHIRIVKAGLEGQPTWPMIQAHARAYPRDAIAIAGALGVYGLIAFSGIADHREVELDFLRSLEPYWRDDWWFDTARGWARIEAGIVGEGLDIAERALAAFPANAQGVHAVSHGYYEQGDVEIGARFIDDWLEHGVAGGAYPRAGGLHCHLSWHRALIALQLGDFDTVHRIYATAIAPKVSQAIPMLTYIDAAALAFRAALVGADFAPQLLADIAAFDADHFKTGIAFLDLHRGLLRLLRDDGGGLDELHAEVVAMAESHQGRQTLAALLDAARQVVAGDPPGAAAVLSHHHADFARLGGSSAQRDLLVDWEIAAAKNVSNEDLAHRVASTRQSKRAPHLGDAWFARIVS